MLNELSTKPRKFCPHLQQMNYPWNLQSFVHTCGKWIVHKTSKVLSTIMLNKLSTKSRKFCPHLRKMNCPRNLESLSTPAANELTTKHWIFCPHPRQTNCPRNLESVVHNRGKSIDHGIAPVTLFMPDTKSQNWPKIFLRSIITIALFNENSYFSGTIDDKTILITHHSSEKYTLQESPNKYYQLQEKW